MEPQTIFIYTSSLVFLLVAYFIPKQLKPYEIYATSIFAVAFGLLVDIVLATKYEWYILDKPGIQIPPLIGQVVLYSSASIITLNLFPFQKTFKWKAAYILGLTVFILAFEFLSFKFGFIKYNKWNMWYSALSYPFLIYFIVLHYRFFQWLVKRSM